MKIKKEYVIIGIAAIIAILFVSQPLTMNIMCPAVYDPVCGVDGVTYSNSCKANVAGVEIDYYRACGTEEPTVVPTPTPDEVTPTPTETPTETENDKPNLLLISVVLIGLSFIVMVIIEKRKK